MVRSLAGLLAALTLASSAQAGVHHSRQDIEMLKHASAFSSIAGDGGDLTKEAKAFIRVYQTGDVKPFLELSKSEAVAVQLFALCGLQHLKAPEATDLRGALSTSTKKTRVLLGCVIPPPTEVRELVRPARDGEVSMFDGACDILTKDAGSGTLGAASAGARITGR